MSDLDKMNEEERPKVAKLLRGLADDIEKGDVLLPQFYIFLLTKVGTFQHYNMIWSPETVIGALHHALEHEKARDLQKIQEKMPSGIPREATEFMDMLKDMMIRAETMGQPLPSLVDLAKPRDPQNEGKP